MCWCESTYSCVSVRSDWNWSCWQLLQAERLPKCACSPCWYSGHWISVFSRLFSCYQLHWWTANSQCLGCLYCALHQGNGGRGRVSEILVLVAWLAWPFAQEVVSVCVCVCARRENCKSYKFSFASELLDLTSPNLHVCPLVNKVLPHNFVTFTRLRSWYQIHMPSGFNHSRVNRAFHSSNRPDKAWGFLCLIFSGYRPQRVVDLSRPWNSEVRSEWSYTATLFRCAFVAWTGISILPLAVRCKVL